MVAQSKSCYRSSHTLYVLIYRIQGSIRPYVIFALFASERIKEGSISNVENNLPLNNCGRIQDGVKQGASVDEQKLHGLKITIYTLFA